MYELQWGESILIHLYIYLHIYVCMFYTMSTHLQHKYILGIHIFLPLHDKPPQVVCQVK